MSQKAIECPPEGGAEMPSKAYQVCSSSLRISFLVLVFLFYAWTAASSGNPFRFESMTQLGDLYNQLVDGFLKGRLSLGVSPPDGLLRLTDPYDPDLNARYRAMVHDVSFFNGKFYLYFGLTPALTLLLPFRIMTNGVRMPINFATMLFAFGGVCWSVAIFNFLTRKFSQKTSLLAGSFVILFFGLSNFVPFLLRRPAMYELAISSGSFFFLGSIYFLLTGIAGEKTSLKRMFLGSLFLGLSIGARPVYIVTFVVPVFLGVAVMNGLFGQKIRKSVFLSVLFGPFASVMLLLFLYNYLRFSNFLEFGQKYQLAGMYMSKYKVMSFEYYLTNFYIYFLSSPVVDGNFPFFHFWMSRPPELPDGYLGLEAVAGVFKSVPVALLSIASVPQLLIKALDRKERVLFQFAGGFLLVTFLISSFLCCFGGATARYLVDFMPTLLISAALSWYGFHLQMKSSRLKRGVSLILVLLLFYGILFNLGISLTGYHNDLNRWDYSLIKSWFSW